MNTLKHSLDLDIYDARVEASGYPNLPTAEFVEWRSALARYAVSAISGESDEQIMARVALAADVWQALLDVAQRTTRMLVHAGHNEALGHFLLDRAIPLVKEVPAHLGLGAEFDALSETDRESVAEWLFVAASLLPPVEEAEANCICGGGHE